jgi:ssDNA-binding Zn-finger/Zn-ribbon topoisomerase 1
MKLSDHSITLWLTDNQLKTEDGKDYDLREHLFWFDILEDWSPRQVWYKAAQVGGTLAAVYKMIYAIKRFKLNAIYTMPSAYDAQTLVKSKVNRIVAQNPVLQGWITGDSVKEKMIGERMAYFLGASVEQQAISIPSDLNIHDEVDRSDQSIIDIFASRLDHSEYKWQWHFSNPSALGNGVSKYWVKSDQKEWFIKCGGCEKEQYLKFPENICFERRVYQCRECKKELTNNERRVGRWVKKVKDAEWSGYHISQMMNLRKSASDILDAYENKPRDYFYNFVLGLPYVGDGNKLTQDQFFNNLVAPSEDLTSMVIGCDSGNQKHWVMGNVYGLYDYGVTEDWADIARLLITYKDAILVVDGGPDITGPRSLFERFPNRVFINFYAQDRKSMQLIRWGEGDETGQVRSDRNRLLQHVVDEFTMGRIPVQGTKDKWQKFYSHWDNMYRILEDTALGTQRIKWESSNGVDHWCHANSYWRIGMERQNKGRVVTTRGSISIEGLQQSYDPQRAVGKLKIPKPKEMYDWRTY